MAAAEDPLCRHDNLDHGGQRTQVRRADGAKRVEDAARQIGELLAQHRDSRSRQRRLEHELSAVLTRGIATYHLLQGDGPRYGGADGTAGARCFMAGRHQQPNLSARQVGGQSELHRHLDRVLSIGAHRDVKPDCIARLDPRLSNGHPLDRGRPPDLLRLHAYGDPLELEFAEWAIREGHQGGQHR